MASERLISKGDERRGGSEIYRVEGIEFRAQLQARHGRAFSRRSKGSVT